MRNYRVAFAQQPQEQKFFYGGLKYFLWRSGQQGDEAVVVQLIPQLVRSVASLLCLKPSKLPQNTTF
jgi:hypothetical protein